MALLSVALLQMSSCGLDQAANLAKGEDFCRQAKAKGADVAVFPEMWNVGYTWPRNADDIEELPQRAIDSQGPFVSHFRALAEELDMAIAITYLERWDGAPRNSVSLIDRHGEIAFTYAKVHTCSYSLI